MNNKTAVTGLISIVLLAGGAWGLYRLGMQHGMNMGTGPENSGTGTVADPAQWTIDEGEDATRRHIDAGIKAGDIDPLTGREVSHYYDPMMPASRFEAPGKSPFMDMMLVPAYADGDGTADTGTVEISARTQQNSGIRTSEVIEGSLVPAVSAVGVIAWNARDQAVMQARALAFIEHVYIGAELDRVTRGQALTELYVPDWVAAQEEFLAIGRMQGGNLAPLLAAAKSRMQQAGMSDEQIRQVEASGEVQPRITLRSPLSGVVTELTAREGMTVTPGMTLFRINGTGTVWADAEVPESQVALLKEGASVTALTPSIPGRRFEGRIQSLLPAIDPALRTRKARMELPNPDGLLVPGMLMQMEISGITREQTLLVPAEAVIDTGRRTVVMLAEGEGRFRPVAVETGLEYEGQVEIRQGLQAGQSVVLSGQFLLDSEASLSGIEARLEPAPESAADDSEVIHQTEARIEAIDDSKVTLTHPPISTLNWPGMTMDFRLPDADAVPADIAAGDQVQVEFYVPDGDMPQLVTIQPGAAVATEQEEIP